MLFYFSRFSDDSLSSHTPKQLELQFLIMHRNSYIRNTTLLNGEFANLPRADGIDFDFKCKNCEVRNICTMQLTRYGLKLFLNLPFYILDVFKKNLKYN